MADGSTLELDGLSSFLASAGIHDSLKEIIPLKGGANNRVYRLDFQGFSLVLKHYSQHPLDSRNRLKAEYEFLSFAASEGIRSIPQPIFQDPSRNIALYTHLDGSLAAPSDASKSYILAAALFIQSLNKNKKNGQHLLKASEACLEPADYLEISEKRVNRLLSAPQNTPIEKKFHEFLRYGLLPRWEEVKEKTCKAALHSFAPSREDLIISPSDFGLHNTLVDHAGTYRFIDFEYAGWDDPAKTICDFFLQPKIPIPLTFFDNFASFLSFNKEKTIERTRLMFPVMNVKWCCIILNVFTQTDKWRRQFAKTDPAALQEQKLELAIQRLSLFDADGPKIVA